MENPMSDKNPAPYPWTEFELSVALRRDNARLAQLLAEIGRLTLRAWYHAAAVRSTNRIACEEADRADGHWDSEWDDARGNESRADFLLDALTSLVRQIEAREAAHDPEPAITSIPLSRGYLRHPCQ